MEVRNGLQNGGFRAKELKLGSSTATEAIGRAKESIQMWQQRIERLGLGFAVGVIKGQGAADNSCAVIIKVTDGNRIRGAIVYPNSPHQEKASAFFIKSKTGDALRRTSTDFLNTLAGY
jgi:hypothetical protein